MNKDAMVWIENQPYFNPHAPDLINKVAEATSIIRNLASQNAELMAALEDAIEQGQLWGQPLDNAIEAIRKAKGA